MVNQISKNCPLSMLLPRLSSLLKDFIITRFRAASGGPRSPFGFEEAFKEGRCIQGGKMHSRREDAFKEGNFSKKRTTRQTDILCAF